MYSIARLPSLSQVANILHMASHHVLPLGVSIASATVFGDGIAVSEQYAHMSRAFKATCRQGGLMKQRNCASCTNHMHKIYICKHFSAQMLQMALAADKGRTHHHLGSCVMHAMVSDVLGVVHTGSIFCFLGLPVVLVEPPLPEGRLHAAPAGILTPEDGGSLNPPVVGPFIPAGVAAGAGLTVAALATT